MPENHIASSQSGFAGVRIGTAMSGWRPLAGSEGRHHRDRLVVGCPAHTHLQGEADHRHP